MKRTTTIKIVLVAIFSIVSMTSVRAQRVALTSNLLEDVVLAPNLGVEVVFADTQSLFLEATVAPFKLTNHYYNKCLSFRAGYKYWFNQALYAHHLILDGVVTSSESGWGDTALRYEYLGAGLGYGYSFIINERLNLIPSIGVGVAYVRQYGKFSESARELATELLYKKIAEFAIILELNGYSGCMEIG